MLFPLCHYAEIMLTQSFMIMQSQLLLITFPVGNIAWNIDCVNDLLKIKGHSNHSNEPSNSAIMNNE